MPLTNTKLSRPLWAALLLTSAAACGPESREPSDWMLETFSTARTAGTIFTASSLAKYTFEEDGLGQLVQISACGRDVSSQNFRWERGDGSTLSILPAEGEEHVLASPNDEWRFARTGVCTPEGADEVRLDKFKDGEKLSSSYVFRGDMCLERFECSDTEGDSQCDDCRTYWCDAPPPKCSDD